MSADGEISTGNSGEGRHNPHDLALQPQAYRYWKDKFACWEYSDVLLAFPSVPADTRMHALFTEEQVQGLQAQIASLREQLAALQAQQPGSLSVPAYGPTEFGFSYAHLSLQEGDKRLLAFITEALGNDHPAFQDLQALVESARLHPGRGTSAVSSGAHQDAFDVGGRYQTYIDQIDAEQAGDEWLRSLVPADRSAVFWQYERFSFAPHDGRVLLIRCKERPVAAAIIVRDGLNRSQLLRWVSASA